jgi:electron transport complex protein RnfC
MAGELGVDLPDADVVAGGGRIDTVIIRAIDSGPNQSVNARCLADDPQAAIRAAELLHRIFDARRTYVAIDSTRAQVAGTLKERSRGCPVRVCVVGGAYPQETDVLLARSIAGVEVPCGARAAELGVWVVDACTVLDLYHAMADRRAASWPALTIAGDAVRAAGNLRFALGSSIRDVVDSIGLVEAPREIIVGSLFNGIAVATADVVLTRATRCLTLRSRDVPTRGRPVACIRCGRCQDVCPVALDPRALLNAAERNRADLGARYHPHACVECGLCEYVCPSWLPLMGAVSWCRERVTV